MLRITENVVSDISLSIVLDLIFFSFIYFISILWKVFKRKKDIQTLDSVSGLHNFLPSLPDFNISSVNLRG